MKTQTKLALVSLILTATLFLQPLRVFAQGSLTPPGAPGPGMKTLAQIEPRTAITGTGAVTISVPESYYLTTNITVSSGDAITIVTNNVTLDLNGFSINSTAASAAGTAILLSGGRTNITISNGHITSGVTNNAGVFNGSGFSSGIYYSSTPPDTVRVKDVSVAGVLLYGIYLGTGNSSVATGCTVKGVGSYGIYCDSATDCGVNNCGYTGIIATTALNCSGSSVGGGSGLSATTALNCYGNNSGNGDGLSATTAQNCYGITSTGYYGLHVNMAQNCYGYNSAGTYGLNGNTAQNCYGFNGGSGYAIYATTAQNCYGYNSSTGYGVYAADIAIGCHGASYSGTGLFAYIASSCRGTTTSGTAQTISFKYNMP
jgi:hypothetical protein